MDDLMVFRQPFDTVFPDVLPDPVDVTSIASFDVLIVGAGISGIDAAYRLQTLCPNKSYAILEARGAMGGTWDLFNYPGIRSDSDMQTLGFPFRPWRGAKAIADGSDIRDYIRDTAVAFGIDRHVRYGRRVTAARWSSADARWTVEVSLAEGGKRTMTCGFLYMCSGYYDYRAGYLPDYPGRDRFGGPVIHPQAWPDSVDVTGRSVVVIGSGATAVTLAPALAARGARVTMLQRSPTYIVSRPAHDRLGDIMQKVLPRSVADSATRWKSVLYGIATYGLARRRPDRVKNVILGRARRQLGRDYDVGRHFTPSYKPWDQRICLVPDGDLFRAVRSGAVTMVTDRIRGFTETGISLESGEALPADIIVSATGLAVQLFGGAAIEVDGETVNFGERLLYKGMMFSGVPNFALAFGYTNASWTLKCDLSARYACRLLIHMERTGRPICVPRASRSGEKSEPMLDFSSGYVQRAAAILPKQGDRAPWRVHQNYVRDLIALKFGSLRDGVMRFERRRESAA